ncbi:FG-GAP repeat protein [Lacunisphaera limnophila]|uniref:FG-GAP repeat protein n=1 Tax=Lacunisphaera limnophila TaxID=1838286 RepID=A0A1I7PHH2_9BACT|nr:VCBS repeat-containing protein [Lacunisphaera limnophila]AOS43053.1 FG-GAP repeat protein [Lacunisphaera limnophila]
MSVPRPILIVLALLGAVLAGWGGLMLILARPKAAAGLSPGGAPTPPVVSLAYEPLAIGAPAAEFGRPWVTHVQITDLDQDGLPDVLYCEAQKNSVRWIRQSPRGTFTEHIIGEDIPGPAHVWAADVNGTGRRDVLVASMGKILPTNERIGAIVVLENLDNARFQKRVLADGLARVTDLRAANLKGHADGRLDLVAGQFGYDQGETRWLENLGGWRFESRVVNTQSGCIHTPVADFDGDGRPDIAALITQEWEEVHLIQNLGNGAFKDRVLWGSTNEQYGGSGLTETDLNRDGRPDLLFTNGDALDYLGLGVRPWFGLQWLENRGDGNFKFHRIGDMPGAFGPNAADLNGDGHLDVLAVSPFADWNKPDAVSLMAWLNDGRQNFTPVVLARQPTHLITATVGDLDGNGVPVIVTGGFHAFPPWENMSSVTLWRRK